MFVRLDIKIPSDILLCFLTNFRYIPNTFFILPCYLIPSLCYFETILVNHVHFAGKDMRIIVYGFRPGTKQVKLLTLVFLYISAFLFEAYMVLVDFIGVILQRRSLVDALLRCSNPERVWDLYAFTCGPSKFCNTNPKERLLNEYFRLLGKSSSRASMNMIEDGSFAVSNDFWRITDLNSNYNLCQTYPFALMVPKSIR